MFFNKKVKELILFPRYIDGLVYLTLEATGLGTGDSNVT